jgi:hypothetical protein
VPEPYHRLARSSFRRAQQRRRRIFAGLAGAAGLSGFVATFGGGAMWEVHVAFLGSLGLYIVLLLETKRRRLEQADKVRSLTRRRPARPARPEEALQAVGGRST